MFIICNSERRSFCSLSVLYENMYNYGSLFAFFIPKFGVDQYFLAWHLIKINYFKAQQSADPAVSSLIFGSFSYD